MLIAKERAELLQVLRRTMIKPVGPILPAGPQHHLEQGACQAGRRVWVRVQGPAFTFWLKEPNFSLEPEQRHCQVRAKAPGLVLGWSQNPETIAMSHQLALVPGICAAAVQTRLGLQTVAMPTAPLGLPVSAPGRLTPSGPCTLA